jgi:hypothetical protein
VKYHQRSNVNLSRLKWVIDSAADQETVKIYDKRTVLGLEFNYVQGGNTANYSDDEVCRFKSQLSHRESLLKVKL